MARLNYGFNLGQIEGLDSSVKTVTLTIANATKTNTYTLKYSSKNGDEKWTDSGSFVYYTIALYKNDDDVFDLYKANFSGSDLGDIYNVTISTSAVEENFKSAVETVLVDNGLINVPETLFDETITLTDEELYYELPSDFPDGWYENAVCTVNGVEIPKDPETEYGFGLLTDTISVTVSYIPSDSEHSAALSFSYCDVPNDYAIIPGNYQVKIVVQAGSGGESDVTYFKFGTASELPTFEQVQRLVNSGRALMFLRYGNDTQIQFGFNEFDDPFYNISYFNVASSNVTIDMYTVYTDGRRIEQTYNTNITLTEVSD